MLDRTWVMYQKRILSAIEDSNWRALSHIYYEMAERVEHEGTDAAYLREQGYKARVKFQQDYLHNHLIAQVTISVQADGCLECTKLEGKIYPSEDARLLNPIPVAGCTRVGEYGCRCVYIPISDPSSGFFQRQQIAS